MDVITIFGVLDLFGGDGRRVGGVGDMVFQYVV